MPKGLIGSVGINRNIEKKIVLGIKRKDFPNIFSF